VQSPANSTKHYLQKTRL